MPFIFCPVNTYFYTVKQIVVYITESTFYNYLQDSFNIRKTTSILSPALPPGLQEVNYSSATRRTMRWTVERGMSNTLYDVPLARQKRNTRPAALSGPPCSAQNH